ncbi:hypothetical protein ASZ90_009253 [hydrocarbon metagenome]|uniref:Right handed beta helix domain-containing protein n=1 Tax=hydrocarbon metagenome TaxID=938273 RepID=A0A0W8FJC4_9ZZZZ
MRDNAVKVLRVFLYLVLAFGLVAAGILVYQWHVPEPTPPPVPPEVIPDFIVAAYDSSAASKAEADYVCDGINDNLEIQAALDALPAEGGVVALSEGTFHGTGVISPGSRATLMGKDDDSTRIIFSENGYLHVNQEYVALDGFYARGTGYSYPVSQRGVIYITAGHVAVRNITATADHTIQGVFYVHSVPEYKRNIENIEFTRCTADSPGTYGFLHSAKDQAYRVHKNIRYTDCRAINCGLYSRYNNWVTGFDFAEHNDVESLHVTRCIAEGNWESGFHFEWEPSKKDVVLIDCVSRNNGQKPFPEKYSLGGENYFGAGYLAPRGEYTFRNCTAEGNSAYGFFFSYPNGVYLYDCVDIETGRGKTDHSAVKPTSFFIIQSMLTDANPSIVMENCASVDSHGLGLYATLAEHVQIRNFRLTNPAGVDGKGAILGSSQGEIFRDSTVNIHASGDRVATMLYAMGNMNVIYSGEILSNVEYPFVIDGYGTANVLVKDMRILSSLSPPGSNGILLTSNVPEGAVRITSA